MKNTIKRVSALLLAVFLLLSVLLAFPVGATEEDNEATILFTHDLHSHLLPSAKEGGGEFGGYARLMTVISQQKAIDPDAILVDGGDFSMGSLFQTAYPTSAIELRMMGAMGYDATTFGNHEFDYLPQGLASMLNAAVASGDKLPAIVDANYLPPEKGEEGYNEDAEAVWEALNNYGVKDYVLLQRGGIPYVLFGLVGNDSDACAPNSGMILENSAERAQRVIAEATAECRQKYSMEPIVIALSHSGTEGDEGEDYELAKTVNGIHLIVSAHTHTTLSEEITVGNTHIVSAGEYGKYLGVVKMNYNKDGSSTLKSYELIPIDETVEADPAIAELVEGFKSAVETDYLSKYGMSFDQILATNTYRFDSVKEVYATQHESTLGNLYSDAYKWAIEKTGIKVDVALTAAGVIRETMPVGNITVSDVFNAASLGVGTEGELIAVYITGQDLLNALEVDASVQPLMSSAQLFFSGIEYSFNTNRMLFNKVDYAMLKRADGTLEEIDKDKLYCVVTGMYAGQMLGSVESTSFGLIAITPRDAEGNPLAADELVNYVVKDQNGNPVKEWYAIASYIHNMGGEMDEAYAAPDGRKAVYSSWSLPSLLRNANKFTVIVMIVVLVLIAAIVLIVWAIIRRRKKKKATVKA